MRERCHHRGIALIAALLLGGCAALLEQDPHRLPGAAETADAVQPAQPARSAEAEISALASFADTVSMLTTESQRQVLEAAEQDYQQTGGTFARLRLALMLALADEALRDLERSGQLLAESAAAPEHPAHLGLSRLLEMLVAALQAEQRQGREMLAAEQARCRAATEQARCDALEQQLDRLKDIERQMNERAQRPLLPMNDEDEQRQDPAGG
jgi:hypothetical protein